MTNGYALGCVDAWTFGDGRIGSPWTGAAMDLACLFPPPVTSVIGALRASLARNAGWPGHGGWSEKLVPWLGDGPNLGPLRFNGPFLQLGGELLYAMPAHVMGCMIDNSWKPFTFLAPGNKTCCDLGPDIRLPTAVNLPRAQTALKAGEGLYVKESGLSKIIRGRLPDVTDLVPASAAYCFERRIGLEIDDLAGAAAEGQLYSPHFSRLSEKASVWIGVDGVEPNRQAEPLIVLGGESRLASCTAESKTIVVTESDAAAAIKESRTAALILLTHADLTSHGSGFMPGAGDEVVPGIRLASACCDRPIRLGGWDGIKKMSRGQIPHVPAGSVLFVELSEVDAVDRLIKNPFIGKRNDYGLGRVAVAVCPKMLDQTIESDERRTI